MRKLGTWIGVLGIVVSARAARAGEGDTPLMVAAEIAPGVGLDGEDIRRVIADELHRRIVAPALAPTVDAEDVLVVAVSEARIVVSFHARLDERASRAIATPPERAARLRAVAWLAGNLARDQVSPLVMAAATAPLKSAAPVAAAPPATPAVVEPPAAVAPPTETPAASAQSEALELRATPAERSTDDPTWTVTASAGPSVEYLALRHPDYVAQGDFVQPSWQLEVQRRRLGGWLLGGALDYGPSIEHGFGLAVTGGMEQRWRGFRFEESLGVGLESALVHSRTTMTTASSVGGVSSQTTVATSLGSAPYARLFATASHPVWRAWDVVARIGAHTTLTDTADDTFFTASLGARLRLP